MIPRAVTNETVDRQTVAGALRVFSTRTANAQPMASYALKPYLAGALSELLDEKSKGMTIREVSIAPDGSYMGRTIGDVGLRRYGVEVTGIGRDGGQQFLPARDEALRPLNVLVMIGLPPNVRRFAEQAGE